MKSFRWWLERAFSLDLRTLALLRAATGLVLIETMVCRAGDIEDFFSDAGFMPRSWLPLSSRWWNPYAWGGAWEWAAALMVLTGLCGVALALGYRSRWAGGLGALLLGGMLARNPNATLSCDHLLYILLLCGLLLPWDRVWSWDGRREEHPHPHYWGWEGVAWKCQLACLYVSAALSKSGGLWQQGSGVEIALHADNYVTPLGEHFASYLAGIPGGYLCLNELVRWGELVAGLTLLFPWPAAQMAGALALMGMHLGMGLCLHLDDFSLVCCVALLTCIPPAVWGPDEGGESLPPRSPRLLVVWLAAAVLAHLLHWRMAGEMLGWRLHWGMFVPPPQKGGWRIFVGHLQSGGEVDVYRGGAPLWERPAFIEMSYRSERSANFFRQTNSPQQRHLIAVSLRDRWNRDHLEQVQSVDYIHFARFYEPGEGYGEPTRRLLGSSTDPIEENDHP